MICARPTPKNGFTLVELLVVIAVIAILAALLLPALSRAKQAADNAVCRNNLRQQGIALTMYVEDAGAYPLCVTPPFSKPNAPGVLYRQYWPNFLEPYAGDKWPEDNDGGSLIARSPGRGVFACPGYNKVRGVYGTQPQGMQGAYAYNAPSGGTRVFPSEGVEYITEFYGLSSILLYWAISPGDLTGNLRPILESEVVSPSRMIAICDSEIIQSTGLRPDTILGGIWAPDFGSRLILRERGITAASLPLLPTDQAMLTRHGGRWNVLFCDGHSENGKLDQFFKFTDDNVLRLWNRDNQPHSTRQ